MHAVRHYDNIDELPGYWREPEARFALSELETSKLSLPDSHSWDLTGTSRRFNLLLA